MGDDVELQDTHTISPNLLLSGIISGGTSSQLALAGVHENKKAIPTYNNPGVKRKVEETLDSQVFKDSNDLFNRRNSQRQWYTMPNTEAMNKQTEFAKWCYMTPPTCKEGNGLQCANNLHNRLNRNSADVSPPSSP